MTPEKFKAKLEAAWPDQFDLLTEYAGSVQPIEAKCRKCGRIRSVNRAEELIRKGCPICRRAEKFEEQLEKVRPGQFELLTEYTGSMNPIVAKCLQCGRVKKMTEARDLIRRGCSSCRWAEKFEEQLEKVWPGQYEILTEYAGSDDPVVVRCLRCGCVRRIRLRRLLRESCPGCRSPKKKAKRERMTPAEIFREELEKRKPGQYELLTEFIGRQKPIEAKCLQCGQIRRVSEARDLIRKGCPICRRAEYAAKRAAVTWVRNIAEIEAQGFTALTPFEARRSVMVWRCNTCGRTIERTPEDAVVRGISCDHGAVEEQRERRRAEAALVSVMKRRSRQLQREEDRQRFINEVLPDYEACGYTVIEIAPDLSSVRLRHDSCGRIYTARRDSLSRGSGCIACARNGTSRGVQEIERILKENGLQYEREKRFESCRRINPLPFDFEILEDGKTKALIEYNGEQHYRATVMFGGSEKLEQIQDSDRIKREWAEAEGIPLLVIRYDEDIRSRLSEIL